VRACSGLWTDREARRSLPPGTPKQRNLFALLLVRLEPLLSLKSCDTPRSLH
jgi:hypothetical protein